MLDEESPVQGFLEEQRVKMVNYIQNVLKDGSHPREDYKELLQLSLLYLGVGYSSMRIERNETGCTYCQPRICFFWHEAIVSRWAPKNDLDMATASEHLPRRRRQKRALTAAKRHVWYLSETNVGFAFLDKRISQADKENLTQNLEPNLKRERK
ncbi:hypothetical protein AVEN_171062-1 [Araneus ventricosus]|uniref:Uncharacterized protein n=1 Tax=Araneus ventricosus TaxID=182803 RepID=A0A4Y2MZI9_ARAVE|nr:hypothetical protein AVEN_171062-1 [Araneus ventricosus]